MLFSICLPVSRLADVSTSTTTDWSKRTLKFDNDFPGNERGASKCLTSREVSQSLDFDISQSVDFELAPHDMIGLSETTSPRRCLQIKDRSDAVMRISLQPSVPQAEDSTLPALLGCRPLQDL